MSIFGKAAATALTSVSLLASLAAPALAASNHQDHVQLAHTISTFGVDLFVNPDYCHQQADGGKFYGFYAGARRVMVICPENAGIGEEDVEWTEEDYDTLRHEAQHLIQDCIDGKLDAELVPFLDDPVEHARAVLGTNALGSIMRTYAESGADYDTVVLEFEAFAIAEQNLPLAQAEVIQEVCPVFN